MRTLTRPAVGVNQPKTEPSRRTLDHPAADAIRLESVLHALSDPVRLQMVRMLADADSGLMCSDFDVPVSASTATHHFRVLRQAGVITQTYAGTAKMSRLRRADLDALFPGLLDTMVEAAQLQHQRAGSS
jgi:DNA-binding transcriptional ArsR family regulator